MGSVNLAMYPGTAFRIISAAFITAVNAVTLETFRNAVLDSKVEHVAEKHHVAPEARRGEGEYTGDELSSVAHCGGGQGCH